MDDNLIPIYVGGVHDSCEYNPLPQAFAFFSLLLQIEVKFLKKLVNDFWLLVLLF